MYFNVNFGEKKFEMVKNRDNTNEQIDLQAVGCVMCFIPTNHSLSSSLMEGPGQRESLNKVLLLQQAVYTLDTQAETGIWIKSKANSCFNDLNELKSLIFY